MSEDAVWESRLVAEAERLGVRALAPAELDAAARDLLRLQRGLTGSRGLVGEAYMDERKILASYLLFYWPVSRAQARFMLDMATMDGGSSISGKGLLRILDLGAGPAPCSIAAAEWLCRNRKGPEARGSAAMGPAALGPEAKGPEAMGPGAPRISITALDRSPLSLESGRRLAESAGFAFESVSDWNAERDELPSGPFDLVVMGHLLNELFSNDVDRIRKRKEFLSQALALLSPGGLLLVIEPALQTTSRETIALRDLLAAEGIPILAPCLRSGSCPALPLEVQSCHSEASWRPPRVVRELARRTGLDKDLLKMTAFVFSRGPETRRLEATGLEATGPEAGPEGLWRVVSDPMLNKAGRIRLLLCGRDGRIPLSTKPGEGFPAEKDFLSLRRSDRVAISEPAVREGGFGLGPGTRLSVSRVKAAGSRRPGPVDHLSRRG